MLRDDGRGEPENEAKVGSAGPGRRDNRPGNRDTGPPQARQDVGPEHLLAVVVLIDGDPGDRPKPGGRGPGGDRDRLAGPGRASDHRQRPAGTIGDPPFDPLARDNPARNPGRGKLGRQNRVIGTGRLPSAWPPCMHLRTHTPATSELGRRSAAAYFRPPVGLLPVHGGSPSPGSAFAS